MADDSMALLEMLRKASAGGDVDVLREGVRSWPRRRLHIYIEEELDERQTAGLLTSALPVVLHRLGP